MNARIASNIEVAALLPEGVEIRPNQAEFSNLEQARVDYHKTLREHAAITHPGLFGDGRYHRPGGPSAELIEVDPGVFKRRGT